MARRPNQPEGLKDMTRAFNVHEKGDGANSYDTDTKRGALCYVPREPIYRVMDFGGPKTASGGIGSPASARFTAGRVVNPGSIRDTREMGESVLPGSINATPGGGQSTPKREPELSGD